MQPTPALSTLRSLRRACLSLGVAAWLGSAAASAATFDGPLEATVRDFCFQPIEGSCTAHPDFETFAGAGETGIVEPVLGADGKPVYAQGDGSGSATTTGQTRFDQWYRDVEGVNTATTLTLANMSASPTAFVFSDNAFFPIDDQLFGNQGLANNFHFTLELHTRFEFRGDEFFTFRGDDDLWVFINGQLAIDLGGVHPTQTDTVDLSVESTRAALGIEPGNTYTLDLFFAERRTTNSTFEISTDLALQPVPLPAAGWMLLSGLLALGAWRRQRSPRAA